jgi:7-cyano-7-deazaguanine synthase
MAAERAHSGPSDECRALVLFSGGQDSATCLAWALDRFRGVETVAFDYGQRHRIELLCQVRVRKEIMDLDERWGKRLGAHHNLELPILAHLGDSALTANVEIAQREDGLPTTFVPGRNLLFLAHAATLAYRRGIRHLVAGMCETDYSGYPDCRDDAVKATQLAINLSMDVRFVIHSPLMWRDKAATWSLAEALGGGPLVEMILEHTHTCYRGIRTERHPWGYGCGACPACQIRANGYARFRSA